MSGDPVSPPEPALTGAGLHCGDRFMWFDKLVVVDALVRNGPYINVYDDQGHLRASLLPEQTVEAAS